MSEDDVAESLIAALADGGEHIDDGSFTLDPTVAYKKLREHQLDDPHGYLLLLVEAAWLAAEEPSRAKLRIELGTTTIVEFSGVALELGSLPQLFPAALGSTDKHEGEPLRRARVLQLLGLAANNALALAPRQIIVEASDEDGNSERIHIDPSGALTVVPRKPMQSGWVRFTLRARPLSLREGMLAYRQSNYQRELLERRCRYTRLAVRVDGELISRRSDIDESKSIAVTLEGRKIGVVGFGKDPKAQPSAWIVNRGVAIADLPSKRPGLHAVVELDLPTDLSRTQLLQGPELDAVRQAIRDASARVDQLAQPDLTPEQVDEARRKAWTRGFWVVCVVSVFWLLVELTNRSNREPERRQPPRERGIAPVVVDSPPIELHAEPAPVAASSPSKVDRELLPRELVRSCFSNAGPACLEAAWYYHYGFIDPGAAKTEAATLLARGCEAGVTRACRLREDLSPLGVACLRGDALACFGVGLAGYDRDAEQQGMSIALAPEVLAAIDRACELDLGDGCYAAGVLRLRGFGVAENLADAEQRFARGCALRHQPSCDAARFTAVRQAIELDQRPPLEPDDPSFPRPIAPYASLAWTP